ncbi:MAG: hypothetical protein Q7R95_11250 [bacterium]|nr:hypothetical protein [bacterium]
MNIRLKFEDKDFDNFRSFERAVKKQLGANTCVLTDCLCFYFEYPKELRAMLRPFPEKKQLEFELKSTMV